MRKKVTIFDQRPVAEALQTMTFPKPEQQSKSKPSALAALLLDFADQPAPALPVFNENPKVEQALLIKTIGARFREARELCNMNQLQAAKRLGYRNSSKLAKVEYASDTNSVPLYLIPRAAKLFDVSTDFLFGLTTDWERDGGALEDRDVSGFLLRAFESARYRDLEAMAALYKRVRVVAGAIDQLVAGARDVADALRTVRERSDAFDTLPAGNRLLSSIERQVEVAGGAEAGMRRFRAELVGEAVNEN